MLEAAIEGADGDDACVIRRNLARDQRLKRCDDARGHDDRVFRVLRIRAVAADAGNLDVDAVDIRHHIAGTDAKLTSRKRGIVVQTDDMIGLGEAREQAVLDHAERAEADLLRGLSDHDQRALPVGLAGDEIARGSDPDRHVQVVPAGVHHAGLFTAPGRVARLRGVRQAGLLDERQPVHVGADHERGAGTVLEHCDEAVAADAVLDLAVVLLRTRLDPGIAEARRHLEAKPLHFGGEHSGRALLLEGKLGIGVQMFVELAKRLAFRPEGGLCGGRLRRGCTCRQQGHAEGEDGFLHGSAPVWNCVAGTHSLVDSRVAGAIR